jgi:uncharacterized Ntn-hydrolase superfamily protein
VASQNVTDPRLGPRGLDLMAGTDAPAAIAALEAEAGAHAPWRQVTAIDAQGRVAAFSGRAPLVATDTFSAPMPSRRATCWQAMRSCRRCLQPLPPRPRLRSASGSCSHSKRPLAPGEEGPVHSAGMLVVDKQAWPLADLRVDWAEEAPIARLRELWTLWQPQMSTM